MESKRPANVPTTPAKPAVLRPGATAAAGDSFLARHGNTILTVALLVVAAALAVRWWNRSAEAARTTVSAQLAEARQSVAQLQGGLLARSNPAEMMAQVKLVQANVTGVLQDVINKADDGATKARALVVRGDLNWNLANLPELPGAATQPALKVEPPADELLRQAADAYAAAVATSGADAESVAAAHLGLAAVAENRGDWAAAKTELGAVADAKDAPAVLASAAKGQLEGLPALQQGGYLTPPSGSPLPATVPTVGPTTGPAGPRVFGPAVPATRPTTGPAVAVPMTPAVPATMPATRPAK